MIGWGDMRVGALIVVVSSVLVGNTMAMACDGALIDSGARCLSPTLDGRVVGISDGDTLTIMDATKKTHKIRLAYIDAPESGQAFGQTAKRQLSTICFDRQARVVVVDTDRYQRSIGVVTCDGVNANRSMVEAGLAWVYRRYAPLTTSWAAFEEKARRERRGLWSVASPVAPWDYRANQTVAP